MTRTDESADATQHAAWRQKPRLRLPALLLTEPDCEPAPRLQRRGTREWLRDAGYALLSLLLGALGVVNYLLADPPVATALLVIDGVGVVVGCLTIFLWRRLPLLSTVVPALLVAVAPSIGIPAAVNVARTAGHRRFPVSASMTVLLVAAWLTVPALYPIAPLPYAAFAVVTVAGGAAVLAWGSFVGARRQLLQSLVERAQRAEAEQQLRVEQAKRTEREHIAREMHDVLAHRLSLLSMHAGALEFRREAGNAETAESLRVIRNSAHQALQDLRETIGVLRAPSSDERDYPQPTLTTLPDLVTDARADGTTVDLNQQVPEAADVPPSVGRTAYRIIQEALTNARKHAPGEPVRVRVHGGPSDGLTVEVRNAVPAGRFASVVPGAGTGLIGLTERAKLAGGRLQHGDTPEGEFRLSAWLPWPT